MVLLAQLPLHAVQLLPLLQRVFASEEVHRAVMLDPLIFDRSLKRRDEQIQALPAEPARPVLVQRIRIAASDGVKQGQFMLPLGLYHALGREPCPDPRSLHPPVRLQAVLLLVHGYVRVPPVKERHDHFCEIPKQLQFGREVPALQDVLNIPSHINGLYRIVVIGKVPLVPGDPVRQIRRPEDDPVFPQMVLIPGKRIVIKGIAAVEVLRRVGVEKMEHQQDIVHILLVKDRQIVRLLLIGKEVPYRMELLCPLTDFRDHKELGDKAFGEQKAGLAVRVQPLKLSQKSFHIGVSGKRRCPVDQLHGRVAVGKIRP